MLRDLWGRLLAWWHTCPWCGAHTSNLEQHMHIEHAGDHDHDRTRP